MSKTAYLITVGEPEVSGVMADEFEETLIYVGRLIERLVKDDNFKGKYIYVSEYVFNSEENKYIKQDGLFSKCYLIEE